MPGRWPVDNAAALSVRIKPSDGERINGTPPHLWQSPERSDRIAALEDLVR
jgi:hypothetical protein